MFAVLCINDTSEREIGLVCPLNAQTAVFILVIPDEEWRKSRRCCFSSVCNIWTLWNRYGDWWRTERRILLKEGFETAERMLLQEELCLSSPRLLHETRLEWKIIQDEIHSTWNQLLKIFVWNPVRILQYTGLGIAHMIFVLDAQWLWGFFTSNNFYLKCHL